VLATANGVLRREAIREAIQMFADVDMVHVHSSHHMATRRELPLRAGHDAIYSVVSERRIELDTSKNIIIHFFVERALLATGLQCYSDTVSQHELWEHVRYLARLFKYEFRFRSDKSCDDAFS